MKLVRIKLQNFKSIDQAAVERVGSINVVFGPTNCGKTSLLESIYFQFNHQRLVSPMAYFEFLHSKADPRNSTVLVETEWLTKELVPTPNLRPKDRVVCLTTLRFSTEEPKVEDTVLINGKHEENLERQQAIFLYMRNSIKLSSSRRPGDSKKIYFPGPEETHEVRRHRFLRSLQEMELQGAQYQEFLSRLQKLFPHLIYGADTKKDILEFFGLGFLRTPKLFTYLFDARFSLILIDEPEIHFYPSLMPHFVEVLREVVENLGKQIILGTHSSLFLSERGLGDFYHITKSKHYRTYVRPVEPGNLLEGIEFLNTSPDVILQSDLVIYTEKEWDVAVIEEFVGKFEELDRVKIAVLQLSTSLDSQALDPVKLKRLNPLSFVILPSGDRNPNGTLSGAAAGFLNRCYSAQLFCQFLDRRGFENYFSPRSLREIFGTSKVHENFRQDPHGKLTAVLPSYTAEWNRRVARAMTREEIEAHPNLKAFFQEVVRVSLQVQ